jgi:hypothetical protein
MCLRFTHLIDDSSPLQAYRKLSIYLLTAIWLCSISIAYGQTAPEEATFYLYAPTASLDLKGTTNSKVGYKVEKGKDSVVTFKSEKNKSELFVKSKASLKKPLEVSIPKKHKLHVQMSTGAMSFSALESDIEAVADSASITMSDITGSLYLFTKEGNVMIRNGEATGTVGSGKGNVVIEDIRGPLQGYSQEGTVKHKFSQAYTNRYNEKLEVSLQKSDLEIATVLAKGGNINVEEGNLSIGTVNGPLQINTGKGNITIASLTAALNATSKTGDITVKVDQFSTKGEINVSTLQGNVMLNLPANFSGRVNIEQVADDANKANYTLQSDFDIGPIEKRPLQDEKGVFAYQTHITRQIGSGNFTLNVWVTNGNLTIKKAAP